MIQSDTHCVRRLRVRGRLANPRLARQRVEVSLANYADGLQGKETILCVSRLAIASSRVNRVKDALEAEAVAATRPARAFVPANANAVLFADRAELLACLARDWLRGDAAERWWWQSLFPGRSLAEAVRQAWIGEPRHVPVALVRLHEANRSAEFLRALPREVITTVSINVAGAFAVEEVREAITRCCFKGTGENSFGEIQPNFTTRDVPEVTKSFDDDETAPEAPWAEWLRVEPNLPPASESLLVLSMMLIRAPTVVRSLKFLAAVRDFTQRRETLSRETPLQGMHHADKGDKQFVRRTERSRASLFATQPANSWVGRNITSPPVSDEMEETKAERPRLESPAVNEQQQEIKPLILEIQLPAPSEPEARAIRASAESAQPAQFSCSTEWGGIFYLINVALALELYDDFTRPRLSSSLPMPVWDFLALMGERLIGPRFTEDGVWNLLATLSRREANEAPGAWFDPPNESPGMNEEAASTCDESQPATLDATPLDRWVNRVAHVVTKHLAHSLNQADPNALTELVFHHEARVLVSSERVTVCFSLAKHPIELRIAGLDRDPGWVPAAGQEILFQYRLMVKEKSRFLFADLAPDPETHFRICFYGSILNLMEAVAAAIGSFEQAAERFPVLVGYNNELAARVAGLSSAEALERWCGSLEEWEQRASIHLPLRALRLAAGLSHTELLSLLAIGLVEEDARFGNIFETLQGVIGQRQPMLAWLRHCLPTLNDEADGLLSRLTSLGVLRLSNPDAPRSEWVFRFPSRVWEVLRHGRLQSESDHVRYLAPDEALSLDELILAADTQAEVAAIPHLLAKGDACTVVVRGPRHNGRHALLGAVARVLGRGQLEIKNGGAAQSLEWNEAGALAMLLNAMLVTEVRLAPGEVSRLPDLKPASLPLGVVLDRQVSLEGQRANRAVVVQLDLPSVAERRQLWQRVSPASASADLDALAWRFRLTCGNIARAARLAQTRAALSGRARIEPSDVLEATRSLDRQGLETLARRLPGTGDLSQLCASERTLQELEHLARRCRHREALSGALEQCPAGPLNCGVRALFSGPTGTGKTLAARLLAARLQKDLYRLDLSSVVNKFIGETEKNLNRLFDCVEELDIMLLLDEGDALLTRRTDVQNANDRYANLETNFLLQRLESFQGILIITTNVRDRIDPAFERRMDVAVTFGVPSAEERWQLWQSHLPASCFIDSQRLAEVAAECELTGGQIHNAVLHATLLALDNGGVMTSEYLEAAVRREYRKRGGICPLRR